MRNQLPKAVVFLLAVLALPVVVGAECNNNDTMRTVRIVHTDVRAVFVQADNLLAPMLENAGDACVNAQSQSLTGEEGMTAWRSCMHLWMVVEASITTSRELFSQLEEIYEDIEAGHNHQHDLAFIFQQIVSHGRSILRACEALGVEIPPAFSAALDQVCVMVNCE